MKKSELDKQMERAVNLMKLTGKTPTVLDVSRRAYERLIKEMAPTIRYECGTTGFSGRPSGIFTDQVTLVTTIGPTIYAVVK